MSRLNIEYLKKIIIALRPNAKFIAINHSKSFINEEDSDLRDFYYVSLYDEKIDSNVLRINNENVLINNTYLSSFAYNLHLCWLYCQTIEKDIGSGNCLKTLLKYNFKKFFAEQLLANHNNIFSRAIFLETLLYEQKMMVDVFEFRKNNPRLDELASISSNLMSSLVSAHELGHIYTNGNVFDWKVAFGSEFDFLEGFYSEIYSNYPPVFVKEVLCDILGILTTFHNPDRQISKDYLLNSIIFAYSAFSVLFSFTKSAKETSKEHKKVKENVDFKSIEKQHRDYTFIVGKDLDFIERSKIIISLCEKIAQKQQLRIFEDLLDFNLPKNILEFLLEFLDSVLENDDENSRAMSMLIAESLHLHPNGAEYLYLRSKIFTGHNLNTKI